MKKDKSKEGRVKHLTKMFKGEDKLQTPMEKDEVPPQLENESDDPFAFNEGLQAKPKLFKGDGLHIHIHMGKK